MSNEIRDAWNRWSDEYFRVISSGGILAKIKADPMWAFPPPVREMLPREGGLRGLRVLVPSSGDNCAAFAFHLLGARVTSADISENQLANAKRIAEARGWAMEFLCADSMTLHGVKDEAYDLVYTSNGVHVWIDDLAAMYRNFHRVLKPGGRYVMFETHPFIRPFDDSEPTVRIVKRYEDTHVGGNPPNYCWRIQDLVNAMIGQGLSIERMEEFHAEIGSMDLWWYKTPAEAAADGNKKFDWQQNPWAALPQWIGFAARK